MALSLSQQLANVEAAILKAEEAEEYGIGSRRKRNANLAVLYKRRDDLQDRIDRESSGGIFRIVQVDKPT